MKVRKYDNINEYTNLCENIPPGTYRLFRSPFPDFLPEYGRYQNNIVLIAAVETIANFEVGGFKLKGPAFEFYMVRDDRKRTIDPLTKEINIDRRILFMTHDQELMTFSFKKDDHSIPAVTHGTSLPVVESYSNLAGLDESGPLDILADRGLDLMLFKGRKI